MSKEKWNIFERCLALNRSCLKAPGQRITFTLLHRHFPPFDQTIKTGKCCIKI